MLTITFILSGTGSYTVPVLYKIIPTHLFKARPSPRLIKRLRIHHNPRIEIVQRGRQLAVALEIVDGAVAPLGYITDRVDRLADLSQYIVPVGLGRRKLGMPHVGLAGRQQHHRVLLENGPGRSQIVT